MLAPMKLLLALALVTLSPAYAQEKPAAAAPAKEESASGGATAPRPSFRRDAVSSQALFDRLDKNRDGFLTGTELTSQLTELRVVSRHAEKARIKIGHVLPELAGGIAIGIH